MVNLAFLPDLLSQLLNNATPHISTAYTFTIWDFSLDFILISDNLLTLLSAIFIS